MNQKTVHVLLVEDDDVDVMAIKRAFKKQKIANPLTVVTDGLQALAALRGRDGHARLPRPYIILLDLEMPRMNGIEFLRELRADPELRDSIVFILSTSSAETDRMAAYQKNVAGYMLKGDAGRDFLRLTQLLHAYWSVVLLPENVGQQT